MIAYTLALPYSSRTVSVLPAAPKVFLMVLRFWDPDHLDGRRRLCHRQPPTLRSIYASFPPPINLPSTTASAIPIYAATFLLGNRAGHIPKALTRLPALIVLDLDGNQLIGERMPTAHPLILFF